MKNRRLNYPTYRKYKHIQLKPLLASIENNLQEYCHTNNPFILDEIFEKLSEITLRLD